MKLDELLSENVVWTDTLGHLVDQAVHYHSQNPHDDAARILRHYIAPMLSHAHDHPADIDDPEAFRTAVHTLQTNFPNPVADSLKQVVHFLHNAMPYYKESDKGI